MKSGIFIYGLTALQLPEGGLSSRRKPAWKGMTQPAVHAVGDECRIQFEIFLSLVPVDSETLFDIIIRGDQVLVACRNRENRRCRSRHFFEP